MFYSARIQPALPMFFSRSISRKLSRMVTPTDKTSKPRRIKTYYGHRQTCMVATSGKCAVKDELLGGGSVLSRRKPCWRGDHILYFDSLNCRTTNIGPCRRCRIERLVSLVGEITPILYEISAKKNSLRVDSQDQRQAYPAWLVNLGPHS